MTAAATTARPIPYDIYGEDDPVWLPGGTRGQAIAMVASTYGDAFVEYRAYRIYLRHATPEERASYGMPSEGGGVCVQECKADHPGAVPGWRVEYHG